MNAFLDAVTIDYLLIFGICLSAVIYVIYRVLSERPDDEHTDNDDQGGNQPLPDLPIIAPPIHTKDPEVEEPELELVEEY